MRFVPAFPALPASVLAALWFGACSAPAPITVVDITGAAHTPLSSQRELQVYVVTSHECPIANAYAPAVAGLAADWRAASVDLDLWIIQADPDLGPTAARQHAADYALPDTVLLDPEHALIEALGATMTPEAIVRYRGEIVYRGRIDDQWHGLGARAQQAGVHDLRDAVAAVAAGETVAVPRTKVIGCLLPEPRR